MSLGDAGPVLLVGAGKMGGALLQGWLGRDLEPARVAVLDPAPPDEVRSLLEARGISLNPTELPPAQVAVLAVKPQIMDGVLEKLGARLGPETLVLSIAAGKTIRGIAAHLGGSRAIVRAMPNTPAAIGRGMSVLVANEAVTPEQRALAEALLAAVGAVEWVANEALLDAVTAVSGSGPAYVFLLAECLAEAGRAAGLPEALSQRLARETVAGAGALLAASDLPAARLRENVTSPGGTTAAALAVLMGERGLAALMREAVAAAARRSEELRA